MKKDGSRFWANEIITRIRDASGTPIGFAKISRDLTVQKAMQDALRESEERSRLLVENARDYAIVMLDPEGTIVSWNTGAERVFGYASGEIIGQAVKVLFTPEDCETGEDAKELATAASEGRAFDERWQIRKGGERFFASGVTTPMRDTDGTLRGFAKICRYLTERQQISEQRERLLTQEQEARLEAERSIRLKDEFLAMVSHELRTPLTAILLWSKLLRIGAVDEAARPEAIDSIEQSAIAQQHLVDDLIDVSRMVSGKMRLHVRDMELWPALEAAIDTVRPMAEAKAIELSVSLDKQFGPMRVDTERMQQVVWNLLTNAVKFTDRGGRVSIMLERVGENALIRVSDNGIGISSEFLPHVFEVFRQADAGTTRLHGGLGLGMAITRQIVELHGGVIRAESAGEGNGATFIVTLPLTSVPTREGSAKPGASMFDTSRIEPVLAGVRVLLVEDEKNTRLVLERLLQACKADVTAVGSAAQAVAAFRQAERQQRFDVIVSDIGMPVEDGFELMRELRAMETKSSRTRRTPAVALTAYARAEDRARALTAGYQLHLSKPVDPAELVTVIATLADKNAD